MDVSILEWLIQKNNRVGWIRKGEYDDSISCFRPGFGHSNDSFCFRSFK